MRLAFGDEAAPALLDARHRPLRALQMLSGAMDRLPIDEKKKVEMDKSVILLGDACETCERIYIPLPPSLHPLPPSLHPLRLLLYTPLGATRATRAPWSARAARCSTARTAG